MKTRPIYLDDPYVKEMTATIIEVIPEQEGVWRLILDQTVFYPMGGGQPTDQGMLSFEDGTKAEIYQVLLKDGEINHYLKTSMKPETRTKIQGTIDWDRRYKNMRVHSAGHVVDFAMYLLGLSPQPLHPIKGDHGKKPFVLYQGTAPTDFKEKLQNKCNELIEKALAFSWKFDILENIHNDAIYLQPGLPHNKPLRALRLESVGTVADGGTIVANTKEVGPVTITDIDVSDGNTSVKYAIVY